MEIMEAIYQRRSIPLMKQEPVPKPMIEKLLAAAVQAPNHHLVRPWRFVVISGTARGRFGEVMANSLHRRLPQVDAAVLAKEKSKPFRAPVVIAVGVDRPGDPHVDEIENICAAAAACENLLLAAEAFGLGGYWRTGDAARDPEIKRFLGFLPEQSLIAFLYIGFPEKWPGPRERPGFEDRTTWME